MKKLSLLSILWCFVLSTAAQKQDYIWQMGVDYSAEPGVQAMQVDFNNDTFQIEVRDFLFRFNHNSQAICDKEGNLLFYTNGCAVLNREHEVMPNGDTLNHSSFKEITGWDDCAYGYPG
ncbi:MAG: hypothetical protein J5I98_34035, partial [Phaeodactylibacter sp.]|nr:hypothetical protein [Phaeodactylibacter sp.]